MIAMHSGFNVIRKILTLSLFFMGVTLVYGQNPTTSSTDPLIIQNPQPTRRVIADFSDLVEKASPAVVNIRTTERVTVYQVPSNITPQDQAEFLRRFFGIPIPGLPQQQQPKTPNQAGPKSQEQERGTGSGFVIDGSGFIDYSEFVIASMNEKNLLTNEKLQSAFKMFDKVRFLEDSN
jgi:serine protease Do